MHLKCYFKEVGLLFVFFLFFFFPKSYTSAGLFSRNNFRKEAFNRSESVRCLFRKLKIFICLGDSGRLLNALLS